jgi:hypothetical protein
MCAARRICGQPDPDLLKQTSQRLGEFGKTPAETPRTRDDTDKEGTHEQSETEGLMSCSWEELFVRPRKGEKRDSLIYHFQIPCSH